VALSKGSFRLGNFRIDPETGQVEGPDGTDRLEPKVMAVLAHLHARRGEVVSREELIRTVWGGRPVVDEVVSRCIAALRRRLGESARNPRFIETVPKRGYRLVAPSPTAAGGEAGDVGAGRRPVLAVLPFQNLSADEGDNYVADGVTELLIANLAQLAALRVISRTSVMRYRNSQAPIPNIAAELGASLIVEGSVLKIEDDLQVVVQLIDASSDLHRWAGTFQRPIDNLLALQNEVTRTIAREISLDLSGSERQRIGRSPSLPASVMEAYLRGRWFISRRTARDCERALNFFEAVKRDAPDFAAAWAAASDALIIGALYGAGEPADAVARARENSSRALELDPDSAEAWSALGAVQLFAEWDFDTARESFRRALSLSPSLSLPHLAIGDTYILRGDSDEALRHIDAALELDPLDLGLGMNRGDFLIMAGRYEAAARQLERTLELDPGFAPARFRLAHARALAGDAQAAQRELDGIAPSGHRAKWLETAVLVHALADDPARARSVLAELVSMSDREYVPPWLLARAHAALADADGCFHWLDRCFEERSGSVIFLAVSPAFAPVRDDPRFRPCLRRLGLDETG
jgi:TolB-like protein/Flp pilus assembly protein TadD